MADHEIEQVRFDIARKFRTAVYPVVIGDASGVIWDDPVNHPENVRVRYQTASGLSLPPVVRMGASSGQIRAGAAAYVGYDFDGTPILISPNIAAQRAQGFNPANNNASAIPATPTPPWIGTDQIVQFASHPTTPISKFIVVHSLFTVIGKTAYLFEASADDGSGGMKGKRDLSGVIPSAGNQCLAAYFLKTDGTLEIVTSTTQALMNPLDLTDIQELFTASSERSLPGQAWWLHDNMAVIQDSDFWMDLRQWINIPAVYAYTPSASADTAGNVGDVTFDNSFIYVKAAGGWRRTALSTF